MKATALLAEDEPLLLQALRSELATAWPELTVVAAVSDGLSAVREARRLLPQVLFLDIRMPGLDGLAAAMELADSWPAAIPLPQLVFVTAYDEYAVQAFDAQAIDYVLKPLQPERLRKTIARVQQALATTTEHLNDTLAQWRQLPALAEPPAAAYPVVPLQFIQASDTGGHTIRMVPIGDVLYFEAADKYVRVLTAEQEYLIRTPLRQLLPQLDPQAFWQVHRALVVRSSAIETVHRDDTGKMHLLLHGRPEKIPVSRLYAHLFKTM